MIVPVVVVMRKVVGKAVGSGNDESARGSSDEEGGQQSGWEW